MDLLACCFRGTAMGSLEPWSQSQVEKLASRAEAWDF